MAPLRNSYLEEGLFRQGGLNDGAVGELIGKSVPRRGGVFDKAVGIIGGWGICKVGGSVGVFVGIATPVRGREEEVVLES